MIAQRSFWQRDFWALVCGRTPHTGQVSMPLPGLMLSWRRRSSAINVTILVFDLTWLDFSWFFLGFERYQVFWMVLLFFAAFWSTTLGRLLPRRKTTRLALERHGPRNVAKPVREDDGGLPAMTESLGRSEGLKTCVLWLWCYSSRRKPGF